MKSSKISVRTKPAAPKPSKPKPVTVTVKRHGCPDIQHKGVVIAATCKDTGNLMLSMRDGAAAVYKGHAWDSFVTDAK
jgi:hypothetical protein